MAHGWGAPRNIPPASLTPELKLALARRDNMIDRLLALQEYGDGTPARVALILYLVDGQPWGNLPVELKRAQERALRLLKE